MLQDVAISLQAHAVVANDEHLEEMTRHLDPKSKFGSAINREMLSVNTKPLPRSITTWEMAEESGLSREVRRYPKTKHLPCVFWIHRCSLLRAIVTIHLRPILHRRAPIRCVWKNIIHTKIRTMANCTIFVRRYPLLWRRRMSNWWKKRGPCSPSQRHRNALVMRFIRSVDPNNRTLII